MEETQVNTTTVGLKNDTPINVAVFIDYENVYMLLRQEHKNVIRLGFFEKLRKWCTENNRRIVRMVAYCNFDVAELHESYHQTLLQSFGIETVHTSNQGKNYADLKITIDVLKDIYSNQNIDEFFIMSNDKDMTPLLNTIRENKRNAVIITTGNCYNPSLCEFADRHLRLEEICKLNVERMYIDGIRDRYLEKTCDLIQKRMEANSRKGKYFTNLELDFALDNDTRFLHLMKYELATLLKELYDAGKIFFYSFSFDNTKRIAMAPSKFKQHMLSNSLVYEKQIIDDFDIQSKIDKLFEDCAPKK